MNSTAEIHGNSYIKQKRANDVLINV